MTKNKQINRQIIPGNLTPIMELSWKSHGIIFDNLCGNPASLLSIMHDRAA